MVLGVSLMKKKYDFTNSESVLKELELLKTEVEKLSKRMGACETSLPEETKNAISLVRSLAQLKGKYKEYETVYNDIVSKTGAISGFAQSAEKSAETIRDITDDIQELSDKADEIKKAIDANPDILNDIETMNEQVNNIGTLYSQAEKDKNGIRVLYNTLFGYDTKNSETGESQHVEGLKERLDTTYDKLTVQLDELEKNTKKNYADTINGWSVQYNSLKDQVENLLPGAMSAGLAEAYKNKRETEEENYNSGYRKFVWMIGILACVAIVPTIVTIVLMCTVGVTVALDEAPHLTLMLAPVCAALIWLGIFQNTNLKTSKKLIEEYSHKEATAKTYAGLAKQIADVGDDDMSQKLKVKLLDQTLDAAAKNPSDCITNHEKSDNPMIALLNVSEKWVNRIGGAENAAKILSAVADVYSNVANSKREKKDDELKSECDSEDE